MAGGCRALRDPAGRSGRLPVSFQTAEPVFIKNFDEQEDFTLSDLLRQHHSVSLVNVPVLIAGAAWGVLEIDSTSPRDFSQDTIEFLTAAAALIAAFVQHHTAEPGEAARVGCRSGGAEPGRAAA
jgi:GAF domain-containing protein